jgi:hypothetical protein
MQKPIQNSKQQHAPVPSKSVLNLWKTTKVFTRKPPSTKPQPLVPLYNAFAALPMDDNAEISPESAASNSTPLPPSQSISPTTNSAQSPPSKSRHSSPPTTPLVNDDPQLQESPTSPTIPSQTPPQSLRCTRDASPTFPTRTSEIIRNNKRILDSAPAPAGAKKTKGPAPVELSQSYTPQFIQHTTTEPQPQGATITKNKKEQQSKDNKKRRLPTKSTDEEEPTSKRRHNRTQLTVLTSEKHPKTPTKYLHNHAKDLAKYPP